MTGEWLSLSEVAEVLGVHPSTVRSWADQGRLPVHRTQGGHRRFRRSEVELLMASESAGSPPELDQVMQDALRQTRLKIHEGLLEEQGWYQKLDDEARDQYRRGGRSLLQGLMAYLSSDENGAKNEAKAIGYEYASIGKRCGLNSAEAVYAFLFFRNLLMNAMFSVYETASIRSSHAWGEMFRKVNAYTDIILITLLETYEAYQRSAVR
ncbi:MAG: helix-turn-helix domain-containing protein [Chloroflexi bacterium]|nr:MAG: helix-turn-helix domain-containing protein [Chloroflexota bacterium]